jgi:hypothetical protein
MRHRLRAAGSIVVALAAITCTDAPSDPSAADVADGRIALSPTFSAVAAQVYSRLSTFGLDLTEVHIVLTGPDRSTKDTTIAFPPTLAQIAIDIPIPNGGANHAFDALIELRNEQHIVFFSGRQTVIARPSYLPRVQPPPVVIEYTGPGKDAKSIAVVPADTIIAGAVAVTLKATAADSAKNPVTDLFVSFSISDPTLGIVTPTDNASGMLTGLGRRGVATITATTPLGISGTARVVFVPTPARVVVISGDGQTGVAGNALGLPLVVEVQASDNLPVPGAKVTFRAVTAGGRVHDTTAVADTAGRATTTLTLGNTAGTYRYEVGAGSLGSASVTAVATPALPTALTIVSGDAQMDFIGRTLGQPLVVKVADKFGGPVEGATIMWTTIAGSGTPSATSTASASDGTARITYTLGSFANAELVRATLVGANAVASNVVFSMTGVNPGAAAIAIVSGGNQSASPNTPLALPLVARVMDALGNPLANTTVTWSAKGAAVTFNPASSATDATGQVTTRVTLGVAPGATTITATVAGLSATTALTINGVVGAPSLSINGGDQQKARAGTSVAIAPSVLLKDAMGNPVANAPVVFSVTSGGGSVRDASTKTNAAGIATSGVWTLGLVPGTNTLSATSGTLSVSFSATSFAAETPGEPKEGGRKP